MCACEERRLKIEERFGWAAHSYFSYGAGSKQRCTQYMVVVRSVFQLLVTTTTTYVEGPC